MPKPIIIFDFDGTIADTFNLMLDVSNRLADEFNFYKIQPFEVETFRNKTSFQVLSSLQIPFFKIPKILLKVRAEVAKQMSSVKPFPDIVDILRQLKPLSQQMGIMTTNSSQNVKHFLENYQLTLFDFIIPTSRMSQKYTELKKFKKSSLPNQPIIYIGDETRDVDAAKRTRVTSIAVTWGYNSQKVLEAHQPDYLVESPQKLLEVCELFLKRIDRT